MSLLELWLPILVCTACVFFCSFLVWAVLPLHFKDWIHLEDDKLIENAIKPLNLKPGKYLFPDANCNKAMRDPAFVARYEAGPRGELIIQPKPNMGVNMALTALVFLCVTTIIAYLGSEVLPKGAPFLRVMQITGTAGVLAYCFAFIPNAIWFKHGTHSTIMNILDGVLYGIVTGVVFGWLWPK